MFNSLQDGPQWYLLPGVHTPPTVCQDWPMKSTEYGRSKGLLFLRLGCERLWLMYWFSLLDHCLWRNPAAVTWEYIGSLRKGQGGKELSLWPIANRLLPTIIQSAQKQILHPYSSLEVTAAPATDFECNLLRDLSEFPTLKNCEIRKIYCFQCYVLG